MNNKQWSTSAVQSCEKAWDQWRSRTAYQSLHFPAAWGSTEATKLFISGPGKRSQKLEIKNPL